MRFTLKAPLPKRDYSVRDEVMRDSVGLFITANYRSKFLMIAEVCFFFNVRWCEGGREHVQ